MPDSMSNAEIQKIVEESLPALKRVFPDYQPPQTEEEINSLVGQLKKRIEQAEKTELPELTQATKAAIYQRGELAVADRYFSTIEEETKGELESFKETGRDKFGRATEQFKEGVSQEEAESRAKITALQRANEQLEKEIEELERKQESDPLSAEELGRRHAAETLYHYGYSLVGAATLGSAVKVGQLLREFETVKDNLSGLETGVIDETVEKWEKWLPAEQEAKQIAALVRDERETRAGLEGQKTTYLGNRLAGIVRETVNAIHGRKLSVAELSREENLRLVEVAEKRKKEIQAARAERILSAAYQSEQLSSDRFDEMVKQVAEVIPGRTAEKKETDRRTMEAWQFYARFRHYTHEVIPLLHGYPPLIISQDNSEHSRIIGGHMIGQEELRKMLDNGKIRQEIVGCAQDIEEGDVVFGDSWRLYRMVKSKGGWTNEEIGKMSIEKRLAYEVLDSMGVHPTPLTKDPKKKMAWNNSKGHDGLRKLFLYDKWGEAGYKKVFKKLFDKLIKAGLMGEGYTLIAPKEKGGFEVGSQLEIAGITPEQIRDNWRDIRGRITSPLLFFDKLRKANKTADAWGKMFKKGGQLIPRDVTETFGVEEGYTYLGGDEKKELIMRFIYEEADESAIRQLTEAVAATSMLKKDKLIEAVMLNGLKLYALYELTGLYFSGITGGESIRQGLEAMKETYLKKNKNASHEQIRNYTLQRSGIDIDGEIPEGYQQWRSLLENQLKALEKHGGDDIYHLLGEIKKQGIDNYKFRKPESKWLAKLLIEDPVNQIWVKLVGFAQRETMRKFEEDRMSELRTMVAHGELFSERDMESEAENLKKFRADGMLTDAQFEKCLRLLEELRKSESGWQRLKTLDGLVHQRWPTPFTSVIALGLELMTAFKFKGETSEFYASVKKWLGSNPAAFFAGKAALGVVLGSNWWLYGSVGPWFGTLSVISLAEVGVTAFLHLLNEKGFQFTRRPYNQYPFRPRARTRT